MGIVCCTVHEKSCHSRSNICITQYSTVRDTSGDTFMFNLILNHCLCVGSILVIACQHPICWSYRISCDRLVPSGLPWESVVVQSVYANPGMCFGIEEFISDGQMELLCGMWCILGIIFVSWSASFCEQQRWNRPRFLFLFTDHWHWWLLDAQVSTTSKLFKYNQLFHCRMRRVCW